MCNEDHLCYVTMITIVVSSRSTTLSSHTVTWCEPTNNNIHLSLSLFFSHVLMSTGTHWSLRRLPRSLWRRWSTMGSGALGIMKIIGSMEDMRTCLPEIYIWTRLVASLKNGSSVFTTLNLGALGVGGGIMDGACSNSLASYNFCAVYSMWLKLN